MIWCVFVPSVMQGVSHYHQFSRPFSLHPLLFTFSSSVSTSLTFSMWVFRFSFLRNIMSTPLLSPSSCFPCSISPFCCWPLSFSLFFSLTIFLCPVGCSDEVTLTGQQWLSFSHFYFFSLRLIPALIANRWKGSRRWTGQLYLLSDARKRNEIAREREKREKNPSDQGSPLDLSFLILSFPFILSPSFAILFLSTSFTLLQLVVFTRSCQITWPER